ncbi:MAG: VOC family protein [Myxococcales bacterium]|nr:VOC family protein [Myxococcales bacterium]MDH5565806.1 VOC family protein [Myxococcales bacterium]
MPHRSRLAVVVIDTHAARREAAVRFWGSALGRARRSDDDPAARYAHLQTPAGPTLDVILQASAPGHEGIHLDIETDDVEAEVKRLEKLGARRKRFVNEWWVMEAPSGHAFCVIPIQSATWPEGAVAWPDED